MNNKIVSLTSPNTLKQWLSNFNKNAIEVLRTTRIGRELRAEAVSELRDCLIKGNNENIRAILLFGSTAKGTAKPNSDIDLMVILNDTDANPLFVSEEEMTFAEVLFSNTSRKIHFPTQRLVLASESKSQMTMMFFFIDFKKVTDSGIKFFDPRSKGKMIGDEWIIVARTAKEEEAIKLQIQAQINSIQQSLQG